MALIEVKYDPTLEQSEIIAQLTLSSVEESGDDYERNPVELQQTAIYGIHCPIISVNNVMVAYEDIISFELDDTKHVPRVKAHIMDRKHLIQYLDTPGNDNEMRVQILPPFDDVYKKINLTFLISDFTFGRNNDIFISGTYKLSKFTSSQYKSFGEVSLYDLFDNIACDTGLGFATNVEREVDKRFVYCPYTSYNSIIESEITHSGDKTTVYDWWIDSWNYLNLVNVYERYNAVDSDDDMKIWISTEVDNISEGVKITPEKTTATLTNMIGMNESQLYVKKYRIVNNPGINVIDGTDKIYSVYSMGSGVYEDTYVSDGDVKKDIFANYEYKGEVYGDYDYISGGMLRTPFLQKMKNGLVEIDLKQPLLGLQRGHHINFANYYNNDNVSFLTDVLEENGLVNKEQTTTPSDLGLGFNGPDTFKLDNSISGQYMIVGNIYKFNNKTWTQTVILARPVERKPKILNVDD